MSDTHVKLSEGAVMALFVLREAEFAAIKEAGERYFYSLSRFPDIYISFWGISPDAPQ